MPCKFSLVIFDLDGTLADTHQLIFDSFNFIMRKYKSMEMTPQEIMSFFGPTEDVCLRNIIGEERFEEGWCEYLDYYAKHLDETTLFPGIRNIVKDLRSSGAHLAVFTGKGKETTKLTLDFHQVTRFFDLIVTGSGVRNHKPHPEGVELALKELRVKARDAVLVGDSISDFKAAGSAGTSFIAVSYDGLAKHRFDDVDCLKARSVEELSSLLFDKKELPV